MRYDRDTRENTTETPAQFLALTLDPTAFNGQVRKHTWSETQPKGTLRFKPTDEITLYGGWSRGFRSGGFNQTGVGCGGQLQRHRGRQRPVRGRGGGHLGSGREGPVPGPPAERRLSLYRTKSENGYFFVFLAANSTQNLGNLDATYKGAELELTSTPPTAWICPRATASRTAKSRPWKTRACGGATRRRWCPRSTLNLGLQYRQPLGGNGLQGTLRLDYQDIGRTWWEPYNTTSRDPISLLDARLGLGNETWTVTAWAKNLTDEKYNAEFSPGGFLFRALPRRYGVELSYQF